MKKILLLIILTSYPVFAACPIDNLLNSCVAQFQPDIAPPMQPQPPLQPSPKQKSFAETPSNMDISREIKPIKDRYFGSNNTEYGYNSNCQFGICQNSGTPKIFGTNNNSTE